MSLDIDYAEITRQARLVVDAKRARAIVEQVGESSGTNGTSVPRKKAKFTRTTTGCLGCRKQKVKCDETAPVCLRCIASQKVCEYPDPSVPPRPKRRRRGSTDGSLERTSSHADRLDGGEDVVGTVQSRGVNVTVCEDGDEDGGLAFMDFVTGVGEVNHSPEVIQPRTGTDSMFSFPLPVNTPSPFMPGDTSFLDDFMAFMNPPTTALPQQAYTDPNAWTRASQFPAPVQLPKVSDLSRSFLLNKRAGRPKAMSPSKLVLPIPPVTPPLHPRVIVIDTMLQEFDATPSAFEFGPSHRNRHTTQGIPTQHNTDVLTNALPSASARVLLHHYCNVTSRILITMGNIGPNPLLAFCTPNKLLDTASATSAAIRMSIMSISVVHLVLETQDMIGGVMAGSVEWGKRKKRMMGMSDKFKKAALSNLLLATRTKDNSEQIDNILATCTLLCIRDDNMEFALNLISKKGGPQAMLKAPGSSFTRRYLLENLATHDVFSSLITGKEPALLGNFDSWWFESVETSATRWEWESVEQTFGISRAMVDLVARVALLDSHKRRLGISLKGSPEEMWDVAQELIRESQSLLLELDIWGNSLKALPQHVRVTCGDYIYKYMAVVFVLADVLEQPITTPRISQSVDYILELCSEASAMRMSVMLIWPLLIAGVFALPGVRPKVSSLFDAFRADYCEDLVSARKLLEEQWRCIDAGLGKRPWNEIMRKLDLSVLLI